MKCFDVIYKIKTDKYLRHFITKAETKADAEKRCIKIVALDLDCIHETKEQGLWSDFKANSKKQYQGD